MDIAIIGATAAALAVVLIVALSLFVVGQQTLAVVERFGKFVRIAEPGLNVKIPFVERVAGRPNLRVQQLDVQVETKTKDDVFVHVVVSVQYFIIPEAVYQAFYRLDDAASQIRSFVFDVVRARVPNIEIDDVFRKKDDIADAVKSELALVMGDFGYGIVKALVTDIEPDAKVKAAMNEINAAQRMRLAAAEKGEADKILKVKAAEADADSKALAGRGIADQRKAIVDGLRESVDEFQRSIPGASPQDVMNLVLMTQYFDTLKDVGASSATNTILIPHSPGAMKDLGVQLRDAMITAQQVGTPSNGAGAPMHHHSGSHSMIG
ncbi:MAG: SPFH domain-containing protein [Myxococcales bacterium]|nr:SPFH domain-containing protein [Myxococcales bacterium]